MVYPHTGSQLEDPISGRNATRTGVSTNIVIQVDGNPVGAIQTLSINENRPIATIDEVGTDGHIDSVPQKSTDVTGSCKRTRFDNLRIAAAFSRGFVHVSSQRRPFDIMIFDIFAADEGDGVFDGDENVITTVIKNVWISKIGVDYTADNFVIIENMDWVAEEIYSYVGTNSDASVAEFAPNVRRLELIDNDIYEKSADVGGRRGALDAAGLIRATE